MKLYSYIPQVSQGPNGTTVRAQYPEDNSPTEIGIRNGRTLVIASDDYVSPQQPSEIDWQEEAQSDQLLAWVQSTRYWSVFQDAKAKKQADRIEALESNREGGFSFGGAIVASDLKSQLLINGVVQMAQLAIAQGTQQALIDFAAGLGAGWRATDGTIVATDAASVVAMGQTMAQHVTACDAVSQGHKASINAAETLAELNAIDVSSGYSV